LQLLTACPHCFVPQATLSGSASHPPASQGPQSIGRPQLSMSNPQRAVHQLASVWHSHVLVVPHT
jgi:hypothetical protein